MRMPSKLYSFEESTLALFIPIIAVLDVKPLPPKEIIQQLPEYDTNNIIDALAALYALGKIRFDDTQGVISLVDTTMV